MLVENEYVADVGQDLPSALTLGSRLAVHQCNAQCHLCMG
ncbi:Uncharacterised protein [Mycobacterium tuberculosis]|nr:Uncharacterised protein [Mycobacterium tuberculosis]